MPVYAGDLAAEVSPRGAGVRLYGPDRPAPLAAAAEVLPRLHRDPVVTGTEAASGGERDDEARPTGIGLVQPLADDRVGQVAASVRVEAGVDGLGGAGPVVVDALHVDAVDVPADPGRDDEVVGELGVVFLERRLESLRGDRGRAGVVVLVVEDATGARGCRQRAAQHDREQCDECGKPSAARTLPLVHDDSLVRRGSHHNRSLARLYHRSGASSEWTRSEWSRRRQAGTRAGHLASCRRHTRSVGSPP